MKTNCQIDSSMAVTFDNLGYTEDAGLNDEKSYKIVYSRGVEKQISNELIQSSFLAVLFLYLLFSFTCLDLENGNMALVL